jgi:hypothetical protein
MKLLTMQFSPASYYFIRLESEYSPQCFFSNTLSLCSSLNVRDHISHPYKNIDKIIVLYILISTRLDSRREDKTAWTEWR